MKIQNLLTLLRLCPTATSRPKPPQTNQSTPLGFPLTAKSVTKTTPADFLTKTLTWLTKSLITKTPLPTATTKIQGSNFKIQLAKTRVTSKSPLKGFPCARTVRGMICKGQISGWAQSQSIREGTQTTFAERKISDNLIHTWKETTKASFANNILQLP